MKREAVVKPPLLAESMGLSATLSSYVAMTSASRVQMVASHKNQSISPAKSDLPPVLTGFENQLANFIFDIRMPCNAVVRNVSRKYIQGTGKSSPVYTIIYQNQDNGEWDSIDVYKHMSKHNVYATELKIAPEVPYLAKGSTIPKGTVLASSPNVHGGTSWANTVNANVLFTTDEAAVEDGFCISRSFAERCSPLEIGSRVITFGRSSFPLNLYGDKDNFKIFPEIGERIREDGIVFGTRQYDEVLDIANLSTKALMDVDVINDTCEYAPPGAIVYDVKVDSEVEYTKARIRTPETMQGQVNKYKDITDDYYRDIIDTYNTIMRETNYTARLGNNLHQLIIAAFSNEPNKVKGIRKGPTIRKAFRMNLIDEYHVEVFYYYRQPLQEGAKLSDHFGTKGIVCEVRDDDKMPFDKNGNRVDLIKFQNAGVARLNGGQFMEQYVSAASRDLRLELEQRYGKEPLDVLWNRLMDYYRAASPNVQYPACEKAYKTPQEKQAHLEHVIKNGIYVIIPPYDPHIGIPQFNAIEKVIQPLYDSVYWVNDDGTVEETHDKMFIGTQAILVLEKCFYESRAVSTGRTQHHGLLSGGNRSSRHTSATKQQSVRANGESEVRLYAASMGGEALSRLLALANDPEVISDTVRNILRADKPTNNEALTDWNKTPLGGSRALALVKNLLECSGVEIRNVMQDTKYNKQKGF